MALTNRNTVFQGSRGGAQRARIEEAVERLLALLDALDGDADLEDGGDAEPSLGAPENYHASQIGWMRGSDSDREAA